VLMTDTGARYRATDGNDAPHEYQRYAQELGSGTYPRRVP